MSPQIGLCFREIDRPHARVRERLKERNGRRRAVVCAGGTVSAPRAWENQTRYDDSGRGASDGDVDSDRLAELSALPLT